MDVQELQSICRKMLDIRKTIKEYTDETKMLNGQLTKLKTEVIEYLEGQGLKNFNHGDGKISVVDKRAVKILDKFKFYEWLKARGSFEETVSITAAKATEIYNEEWEAAQAEGDIDFLTKGIDGLSEPNVFRTLSFRK